MKHFKTPLLGLALAAVMPLAGHAATVTNEIISPIEAPLGFKGTVTVSANGGDPFDNTFSWVMGVAGSVSGSLTVLNLPGFSNFELAFGKAGDMDPVTIDEVGTFGLANFGPNSFALGEEVQVSVKFDSATPGSSLSFNLFLVEDPVTPPPVVPLPAGLPLLMAGLAGLAFLRARQKSA